MNVDTVIDSRQLEWWFRRKHVEWVNARKERRDHGCEPTAMMASILDNCHCGVTEYFKPDHYAALHHLLSECEDVIIFFIIQTVAVRLCAPYESRNRLQGYLLVGRTGNIS